ncbi:alpha-galactosidase [Marivivens niveibacter]|uniref:Alpha-galactosidase n=1 Tax=Marivivens niveibacter TaxID=1930667 RepID=A0A251WVL8_9RHOB|nr:alpha-galactosidase [Marivivens niveibacter]OUD08530.1 alpha-galactosidase [Marivivens niveibacter]
MIRHWILSAGGRSLILASINDRLPFVAYWGAAIADGDNLIEAGIADVTGGMIDENADLSICPEASRTFPGQPGMSIAAHDGTPIRPRFTLTEVAQGNGLSVTAVDEANDLTYVADFCIDAETSVLTAKARLDSNTPIRVHYLSAPVFPASHFADDMIDFAGRWIGEFQQVRTPWAAGIHMRENLTGRTGHEHFPALIVPERGATNTAGSVQAFHYGWSGGHRMIAEELPDGRRQIQFGRAAGTQLTAGTHFETAPLYAVHSDQGLNGCAVAYQHHLRDRIVVWPHPDRPRPVHYNCWEAIYFDHKLNDLTAIADRAAALGAERFVLDDGWFGRRDDDTSSLGDWEIDERKYPDGLGPLIDYVHGLGMTFGIWFEPEMVNPDSDLYRAHPEWALGAADQVLGRQQMVLDMANLQVRDYLYERISAVLSAYDIDYIKWDHNRVLPMPDAAQALGYYDLLSRLRTDFPNTEIESCSSGGGRIDFGALSLTQRVWLSDSNDALERLRIQHNAALFLPMAVTGSHVGPRHCHTSGRVIDIRMRAWVAAQRHMGFEMDPRELTDDETAVLRDVTAWWKSNRDWMKTADILRLDSADPSVIAEQQLSADGDQFVVFAGLADTSRQILPRPIRLTRLDPSATYRITLVNRDDTVGLSRGNPALKTRDLTLSGQALMARGITLPWSFPLHMWVIKGQRL